jgi:hypothetical protein
MGLTGIQSFEKMFPGVSQDMAFFFQRSIFTYKFEASLIFPTAALIHLSFWQCSKFCQSYEEVLSNITAHFKLLTAWNK